MTDLIVRSNVDELLDEYDASSDFYHELNAEVSELVAAATRRAEAHGRKTVMPRDL